MSFLKNLLATLFESPQRPARPRRRAGSPNRTQQAISESVDSLLRAINESFQIAESTQDAKTRRSRITVARKNLHQLKRLTREFPFVSLPNLSEFEADLNSLEAETCGEGAEVPANLHDVLKGYRLVAALDEESELRCLLDDGKMDPAVLRSHQECRCVKAPVAKSLKELGLVDHDYSPREIGARASAIGEVPRDGGLYKAFLIEQARVREAGGENEDHPSLLLAKLETLRTVFPDQEHLAARVRTQLLLRQQEPEVEAVEELVGSAQQLGSFVADLMRLCAKVERLDLVDAVVEAQLETHRRGNSLDQQAASVFDAAGRALSKSHAEASLRHFYQVVALAPEYTRCWMDIAKLNRRIGNLREARAAADKVLLIKPGHKGAQKEIDRIGRLQQ
ncbi:MAG: hypothetical protein V2A76_18230 [Planctomycetota bacterium]